MASPPPSRSAGEEEPPNPAGLPPTERFGSDLDPWAMDAGLETRSLDPEPGNTAHNNLPARAIDGLQIRPLTLETASLGVAPTQEPDTQSQPNVPRAGEQPQTPQTPVLGPGSAPGWRKRVINVKNKIGSTRLKQPVSSAPTSQSFEGSRPDSSKQAPNVGQGKATEAGKPEAAKRAPLPKLVDLSNLPPSLLPTSNIIAIPDIGQSLSTAWAYTFDKAYPRPKQSTASTDPIPGPAQAGCQPVSHDPASFKAALKALEESKTRAEREGHVRGRIQGWTDRIDLKAPDHPTPALASEPTPTPLEKGKKRDDGGDIAALEEAERGRRPLTPQQLGGSAAEEMIGKKADADDRTSRHSNRPSSARGSKPPSEKDRGGKAGNWLTDRMMLPYDVHRAQVWGFDYKCVEPTQFADSTSKKTADYNHCLDNAAAALALLALAKANEPRALVFVATGFGCLIVQRMMVFAKERGDEALILPKRASVLFLDPPTPILKEKPKTEKVKAAPAPTAPAPTAPLQAAPLPTFPGPASFPRANRVRAILESKAIDSWDLWERFHVVVREIDFPVIWFYSQAQMAYRNGGSPRAAGVDFVMLTDLPPAKHTAGRVSSRFRGPGDANYTSFVEQIKRVLLLRASAFLHLEELLTQCISEGYNLRVKDHAKRNALHLAVQFKNDAALIRLISAGHELVLEQDKGGMTPLHMAVNAIVNPQDTLLMVDQASYRMMIEKILSVMAERGYDHDIRDSLKRSAWSYARGDQYQWVRDLKDNKYLLNGAKAAQPDAIENSMLWIHPGHESACQSVNATLAQFYISNDDTSDYLEFQRPDIWALVYNEHYGIHKLFERNLRHDDDKRATCRWVHFPANNERWIHDLFSQQLNRLDKSTIVRRHQGTVPFDRHITPGAVRYKQHYNPRPGEAAPFPSPAYPFPSPSSFSSKSGDGFGAPKKMVTALFMPVFGFERHENRKKLSFALKNLSHCAGEDDTSFLIWTYFRDKAPLHCRRTLDQFTYHMLEDTERRDNTQVISRWTKREGDKRFRANKGERHRKGSLPVLMIDQLWLWILEDEQTVITSLPDTWDSTQDYNLVRHIMQNELRENDDRPLIKGCTDLANSIIRRSVDFLHRPGPHKVTLYECFQSSITLVAEQQALQFEEFKSLVRNLNQDGIDVQRRATLTNDLFQLTTETRLLAEIMDIQDELKTIHEVFLRQRDALKKFAKLMSNGGQNRDRADDESDIVENTPESSQFGYPFFEENDLESPDLHRERRTLHSAMYRDGGRPKSERNVRFADEQTQYQRPKARNQAEENLHLVESNIITIKEMTTYAEKVRIEINGLLSHRQKQANAWEARFAREGSEHTQRQSNITLVFTAVTVLFLPLSFMSSVFAIQIDAFPHNPETGEVNWPLGKVMGLLFGLSLGTIILVAFFGFYINRISHLYTKYFGGTTNRRVTGRPLAPNDPNNKNYYHPNHPHSEPDSDDDSTAGSRTSGSSHSRHWQQQQQEQLLPNDVMREFPVYAPLFNRWHFHQHIPFVRELWRWREYEIPPPPPPGPPSPPYSDPGFDAEADAQRDAKFEPGGEGYVGDDYNYNGNDNGNDNGNNEDSNNNNNNGGGDGGDREGYGGDGGGEYSRAPSVRQPPSSWGEDGWEVQYMVDYPMNRAWVMMGVWLEDRVVRPLERHAPAWLLAWLLPLLLPLLPKTEEPEMVDAEMDWGGQWGEQKEEFYDGGGGEGGEEGGDAAEENSIRPSMQRTSVASGTEGSWQVPEGPLRRRRSQPPDRLKGASKIVSGLFPWRWRRQGKPGTVSSSSEDGRGSVRSSVDVVLDPDENDSAGARGGADDGEGGSGKKGIGLGMLPSFHRKKGKEDDPESGNRFAAWAGNLASKPGGVKK